MTRVGGEGQLDAIPFPVAYPLSFVLEPALSSTARLDNLIFTAYQAMRTAGLIMLADYLDVEASDAAVQDAIRGLRQPHWGEWSTLNQKLCRFWASEARGGATRFPTIVEGWRVVGDAKAEGEWRSLLQGVPGAQGPARNANDALQKLRNDRAHRMATRTPESREEEAMLERSVLLVTAMCEALFPPGGVLLLRRVSAGDAPLAVVRLHGAHRDLTFSEEAIDPVWSGLFDRTGVVAVADGQGVSIYPLFAPDEAIGGRETEVVTLVNGVSKKSVALLGVRGHCQSERLFGPLMDAFARKNVDFGLGRRQTQTWSLVDWSRGTSLEAVAELRGRKYFPECYVERRSVDERAVQCLARSGSALLVLGEAGSGKSSLLARLVEGLAADDADRQEAGGADLPLGRRQGDVVLFLAGRQAYAGDLALSGSQLLVEAVLRRAGIKTGAFTDLADLCRHLGTSAALDTNTERRLWLVFDALNEADRFLDLVGAVDAFLPMVAKCPWLRVVLSMRRGAYASLERRHEGLASHGSVFAHERHLTRFHDDLGNVDVPFLEVKPFDANTEAPIAYRRRAEAFPERACSVAYENLPTEVLELLLNPLHLHVFHETYAGRANVAPDLDAPTLLASYLDRLGAEHRSLQTVLARVGQYMVAHGTPALPVDIADVWLSEWRAHQGFDSVAHVVKLDPIEELVSASVLMRPAREGFGVDRSLVAFTFSHQRLCEQVVVRELQRSIAPRAAFEADDLARFAEQAAALPAFVEYLGALRIVVGRAARTGDDSIVAALLELPHDEVRRELIEVAVKCLGLAWGHEESGRPGPRTSLAALAAGAVTTDRTRRAWLAGSDLVDWLARRGASYAALALSRSRVAAARTSGESTVEAQAREVEERLELADSLDRFGRAAEVLEHIENAVAMARRLVERGPDQPEHWRVLASALRALGNRGRAEGRLGRAREHFEEALTISRKLVEATPEDAGFLRSLSSACNDLAGLEKDQRRGGPALALYEEALAIDRRQAASDPDDLQLLRNVATACDKIGDMALDDGDLMRARPLYEEALAIRRKVAAAEPDRLDFVRRVASAHKALGRLEFKAERLEAARRHFEAALVINRRLAAAEPDQVDFAESLSTALDRMASVELRANRSNAARVFLEEALLIDRRLARLEPNDSRRGRHLSLSCDRLGELALREGNLDSAQAYFEEALATDRRLAAGSPEVPKNHLYLGGSLDRLAELARRRGNEALARAHAEESLEISMRLLDSQNPESMNDLAMGMVSVGQARLALGDTAGALALTETALEYARRAFAARSEPHVHDTIAELLELRGECLTPTRPAEARAAFDQAIEIWRGLVRETPTAEEYRPRLARALRAAAKIATEERRPALLDEAGAVDVQTHDPGQLM